MRKQNTKNDRRPSTGKAAATYKRLLAAGEHVFTEHGYHAASVSAICREAGVAQGTFYRYFLNKEEVYLKLIELLQTSLVSSVKEAIVPLSSATEQLLTCYKGVLAFVSDNAGLYHVFRQAEFINLEVHWRFHESIVEILEEILNLGIRNGEFRQVDADVTAYSLLGIIKFIAMRYIIWEPEKLYEATDESVISVILHGLDTGKEVTSSSVSHAAVSEEPKAEPVGGEATRQSLLRAAEKLFGEAGFHKTSISAITYVAGVAQGTFYLYFPSKVSIFTQLVEDINHRLRALDHAALSGLSDRRQVEREGFRTFFEFISKHPAAYRIIREAEFIDEQTGRWYYEQLAKGYVRGLRRGMDHGEIHVLDPEPVAYGLLGMGHFIGLRWLFVGKEKHVSDTTLAAMLDFILHGVLAQ